MFYVKTQLNDDAMLEVDITDKQCVLPLSPLRGRGACEPGRFHLRRRLQRLQQRSGLRKVQPQSRGGGT